MIDITLHHSVILVHECNKMALYFATVSLMILLIYRYINAFRKRNVYYRFQRRAKVMKRVTAERRWQQQRL